MGGILRPSEHLRHSSHVARHPCCGDVWVAQRHCDVHGQPAALDVGARRGYIRSGRLHIANSQAGSRVSLTLPPHCSLTCSSRQHADSAAAAGRENPVPLAELTVAVEANALLDEAVQVGCERLDRGRALREAQVRVAQVCCQANGEAAASAKLRWPTINGSGESMLRCGRGERTIAEHEEDVGLDRCRSDRRCRGGGGEQQCHHRAAAAAASCRCNADSQ